MCVLLKLIGIGTSYIHWFYQGFDSLYIEIPTLIKILTNLVTGNVTLPSLPWDMLKLTCVQLRT